MLDGRPGWPELETEKQWSGNFKEGKTWVGFSCHSLQLARARTLRLIGEFIMHYCMAKIWWLERLLIMFASHRGEWAKGFRPATFLLMPISIWPLLGRAEGRKSPGGIFLGGMMALLLEGEIDDNG